MYGRGDSRVFQGRVTRGRENTIYLPGTEVCCILAAGAITKYEVGGL